MMSAVQFSPYPLHSSVMVVSVTMIIILGNLVEIKLAFLTWLSNSGFFKKIKIVVVYDIASDDVAYH